MAPKQISLSMVPLHAWIALSLVFLLLLSAHAIGLVMTYGFGHDHVWGLVPLFNFGLEANVPTFYESSLFMLNGLLFLFLWRLGNPGDKERKVWLLLAVVFFFLAVDEFAMVHELLIAPVRQNLRTGGLLFFAWVMPYLVLVVFLGAWIAPSLWRLGTRLRLLFGMSAAVFVSGAVGLEMLGGRYYQSQGQTVDLTYRLFQTAEEAMECTGLLILTYTLLELVSTRVSKVQINIDSCTFNKKTALMQVR